MDACLFKPEHTQNFSKTLPKTHLMAVWLGMTLVEGSVLIIGGHHKWDTAPSNGVYFLKDVTWDKGLNNIFVFSDTYLKQIFAKQRFLI